MFVTWHAISLESPQQYILFPNFIKKQTKQNKQKPTAKQSKNKTTTIKILLGENDDQQSQYQFDCKSFQKEMFVTWHAISLESEMPHIHYILDI